MIKILIETTSKHEIDLILKKIYLRILIMVEEVQNKVNSLKSNIIIKEIEVEN